MRKVERVYEIKIVNLADEFRDLNLKRKIDLFDREEEEFRNEKSNKLEWYDMNENIENSDQSSAIRKDMVNKIGMGKKIVQTRRGPIGKLKKKKDSLKQLVFAENNLVDVPITSEGAKGGQKAVIVSSEGLV